MCLCLYFICAPHVCSALRGQKRALDFLELELPMTVNWALGTGFPCGHWVPVWALGTKPRSSLRAVSALKLSSHRPRALSSLIELYSVTFWQCSKTWLPSFLRVLGSGCGWHC